MKKTSKKGTKFKLPENRYGSLDAAKTGFSGRNFSTLKSAEKDALLLLLLQRASLVDEKGVLK